jgi:hypothetical protein
MATKNHGHQQDIMVTKRNLQGSMAENDFQCLFIYLHKIGLHYFVMTQSKVFPNHCFLEL